MSKISLITGATSGIGFATAQDLARQGHHILLHARTMAKAETAKAKILETYPTATIDCYMAELVDPAAIEAMAKQIKQDHQQLDNLINNAGIWNSVMELDSRGVEKVLAVNHLAYFQLTYLLLPLLRKVNDARIINVASDSHRQIKGMFWEDLNLSKNYHGLRSYAQSKLANVLFVYEFERLCQEQNLSIYAVQPGLVRTDIGLKGNTWLHRLAWRVRRRMSGNKTPLEGASTSIFLATDASAPQDSGKYFDDCKPKQSFSSSYDEEEATKLWAWSLEVCGLEDYFA